MSAVDRPLITAIMPAYNASRYIGEALDSLLRQTLCPSQIIVVDDGSTDDTPRVLEAYRGKVVVIRQKNAGESAARNRALVDATGKYVALLDADDVSAPERFERQAEELLRTPDAIACFTGYWKFNDQRRLGERPASNPPPDSDSLDFLSRCMFHIPSVMFDRTRASGLRFPVGVKAGPDIVFSSMLATRGRLIAVREPLYGYRSHAAQISIGFRADAKSNRFFEDRYNWAKAHWPEHWPERSWEQVERKLWEGLARQTEENYWARHKQFFLNDRTYMRKNWPSSLSRPSVLDWRWYPDWLWMMKHRVEKWTTSDPHIA